ncbi:DUF4007 family protein [Clostridium botulinum]|uniref:DUF4007 family protein n=1 Tax=Clostridium botulinum TaxID=1491 RepID=UPI000773104E|nr:DUF4007 family protein [Clostridium botulinum]NFH80186.1 DUF4007 family protein [Clostridium botulinum]NFH81921.1 DUF4007 family protein [Clostridium botulinum]NFI09895.1 DUF4007 family protein [Clostridium botulinum]NFI14954.1 DUF4007 family protein [Clostridium botulinum]NFO85036.1 DUF4007 family protein [Clostridium botulinum]
MEDNIIKFRLKAYESFYIREGWLAKGIRNVNKDCQVFIRKDATDILGIGVNMVKSLRYWLQACGLTKEVKVKGNKREQFLTQELGQIIFENDPYFEDIFSLWLVHYMLVSNMENCTSWYLFFNEIKSNEFTKEELRNEIMYALNRFTNNTTFAESSLFDDCECIIKTYINDKKGNKNPEDNISCPLSELGLLSKATLSHGKEVIKKIKPSMDKLDKLIILYIILDNLNGAESISIENILTDKCNAGRVLNLDRNLLNEYLDLLKNAGYIEINRTAGLNQVYPKKCSKQVLLKEYYEQLME